MSEEYDDTQSSGGDGIASLRKAYETQKKQNDELIAKLNAFEAKERKQTVAGVLKAKGISEKAASLYNGDDASEEAVGKWLEEFGDVFGLKAEPQEQQTDAQAQQVQRVQNAAFTPANPSLDTTPGNGQVVGDPLELLSQVNSAKSVDDLVALGILPPLKGTLYDNHGRA